MEKSETDTVFSLNCSFGNFKDHIIKDLIEENNKYFFISDVKAYVSKIQMYGKIISFIHEEKIIAYVLYYDNQDIPFISMVFVDKKYRKLGLAKKLINILKILHNQIKLEVDPENYKAIRLYKELNFDYISDKEMQYSK